MRVGSAAAVAVALGSTPHAHGSGKVAQVGELVTRERVESAW